MAKEQKELTYDESEIRIKVKEILQSYTSLIIKMNLDIKGRYVEPSLKMNFVDRISTAFSLNHSAKSQLTNGMFSDYKTGDDIVSFLVSELKPKNPLV